MSRSYPGIAAAVAVIAFAVGACARGDRLAETRLGATGGTVSGPGYGRGSETGGHGRAGAGHGRENLAGDLRSTVGDIVYFSSDSTDLTPETRQTLDGQVRWLARHSRSTITIEGHADERGTREYNIGLGAKRAEAVRAYLAAAGVQGARIRVVSFGKERPVATCNDISCWSQNRRAQTVVVGMTVGQR